MTVTMATVSFEDSVAVRSGRCRRGRDDHHLDLWLPFPPSDLSHVSLCLTVPSCPASVRFSSHPTLPERSLQSCFSSLFYFIFATCMTTTTTTAMVWQRCTAGLTIRNGITKNQFAARLRGLRRIRKYVRKLLARKIQLCHGPSSIFIFGGIFEE